MEASRVNTDQDPIVQEHAALRDATRQAAEARHRLFELVQAIPEDDTEARRYAAHYLYWRAPEVTVTDIGRAFGLRKGQVYEYVGPGPVIYHCTRCGEPQRPTSRTDAGGIDTDPAPGPCGPCKEAQRKEDAEQRAREHAVREREQAERDARMRSLTTLELRGHPAWTEQVRDTLRYQMQAFGPVRCATCSSERSLSVWLPEGEPPWDARHELRIVCTGCAARHPELCDLGPTSLQGTGVDTLVGRLAEHVGWW